QIQLDLQPGQRLVGVEPKLVEHQGEQVQTSAHLLPVPLPVLVREHAGLDFLAHRPSPGPSRVPPHAHVRLATNRRSGVNGLPGLARGLGLSTDREASNGQFWSYVRNTEITVTPRAKCGR